MNEEQVRDLVKEMILNNLKIEVEQDNNPGQVLIKLIAFDENIYTDCIYL